MSLILRHRPEVISISLDEHGWADVDGLINGIAQKNEGFNMDVLEEIVRTDSKQRYSFNDDKSCEFCIKQSFVLLKLKEYIEDKYSFMDYQYRDAGRDIVIYTISDKDLNIWLQEDYSFITRFLVEAENVDYDVSRLLDDRYFGYNFTNVCESILYDKKQNKTA